MPSDLDVMCDFDHKMKLVSKNPYSGGPAKCDGCDKICATTVTDLMHRFHHCSACQTDFCSSCVEKRIQSSTQELELKDKVNSSELAATTKPPSGIGKGVLKAQIRKFQNYSQI